MPNSQSAVVAELYRSWVAAPAQNADWSIAEQQMVEDTWISLTSEPGGVDYIEVDAGGLTAMWANPHGPDKEAVLFGIHGGGFVSGSMYTHRPSSQGHGGACAAPQLPAGTRRRDAPIATRRRSYRVDPRHPYVSPLFGDLTGLAPLLLQVGDLEQLLHDSRELAVWADKAGVEVRLEVFEGQQHTFQMMAGRAPEADDAITRCADWVLPRIGSASTE